MFNKIAFPVLLACAPLAPAQQAVPAAPAPTAPAAIPAEAPAAATPAVEDPKVVILRSQLAVRQQRVTALVNQIIELDAGIEKAIANVQNMLKGITDSKDSNTKVSNLKQDVMKRLQKAAEYYDQKRSAASADLQSSKNQLDRADLFKDRSVLDERINKRVEGIIELALSMDSHEDYEKYLYSGGGGWDSPSIRRNSDYDHNRKVARQSDNAKTAIEKVLDTSVDRLDVQERNLKQKVATAKGEEKARLEKELERVSALKLQRFDQTEDLRIARETKGRPVSLKEANRMEDIVEDVAADARRDLQSLFARYSELKVERSALARIQAALEALETTSAAPAPLSPKS